MLKVDAVAKTYARLYRMVYNHPDFVFNLTEYRRKIINGFISKIPFTAGDHWLNEYICFQFYRFHNQRKRFQGVKNISWFFGDKALEKWSERTPEQLYYCQKFQFRYNIRLKAPFIRLTPLAYQESEKYKFHNTYKGFAHCFMSGFKADSSPPCKTCNYREFCLGY